jgi:type IV pilus assembly protein PilA
MTAIDEVDGELEMKQEKGFTLIELLIVVAIMLIIAALAIPSYIKSKMSANEASAAASVRSIMTAEMAYATAYPANGYANTLANLGGADPCTPSAETACLLDQSLAGGVKAGYSFAATGGNRVSGTNMNYVAGAAPLAYDQTGVHMFCATEKNVLRSDVNADKSTIPPNAQQCAAFRAM